MRRGKRTVRISNAAAEVLGESPAKKMRVKSKDPLALPKRKTKATLRVPTKAARKQTVEEPEEYEVEKIISHKVTGGKTYYRIRWKGWAAKDDTWQQEADLNCKTMLTQYKGTMKAAPVSSPKKAAKPAAKRASLKASPKKSPVKKKGVAAGKVVKAKGRNAKGVLSGAAKRKLAMSKTEKKPGRKPKANKEWEVEEVVAERTTQDGKEEFLIKWKGYSTADNTWEPAKNVQNCGDAIDRFRNAQANGNAEDTTTTEAEDTSAPEEEEIIEEQEVVVERGDGDAEEAATNDCN